MKNKDETNHLMLNNSNQDNDTLSKRISALEHHLTVQNTAIQKQFEEMYNYCKFYRSLYCDLKVNFMHTKHVLLSKIAGTDDHEVFLKNVIENQESDKIKDLQEEIHKLKLENEILKAKLALKEQEDVDLQEEVN